MSNASKQHKNNQYFLEVYPCLERANINIFGEKFRPL